MDSGLYIPEKYDHGETTGNFALLVG